MTMDHYYGVIMAGGGGTRLWPLSRRQRPKQTLRLLGDRSLFQIAVDRAMPLIPPSRLRIVTIERQLGLLREQRPELPDESFIIEPSPKGTASVVGLAAVMLEAKDPEAVMAVLTADHAIGDEAQFRDLLAAAYSAAQQGHLVTLGIEPTEPAVGYGYLQRGKHLGDYGQFPMYEVESFREKPDRATAQEYFESDLYSWNSGMFVWRVERILAEIEKQMPELMAGLNEIRGSLGTSKSEMVIQSVWRDLQSETIDYGVMEQADDVVMLPAGDLGWRDVGSWDSLFEVLEADETGNYLLGEDVLVLDSQGNLVVQEGEQSRIIALVGVKDIVVVDTGNALLVTNRVGAQKIRDLVKKLNDEGLEEYL